MGQTLPIMRCLACIFVKCQVLQFDISDRIWQARARNDDRCVGDHVFLADGHHHVAHLGQYHHHPAHSSKRCTLRVHRQDDSTVSVHDGEQPAAGHPVHSLP